MKKYEDKKLEELFLKIEKKLKAEYKRRKIRAGYAGRKSVLVDKRILGRGGTAGFTVHRCRKRTY